MKLIWTQEAIERLFEIEDFIYAHSPGRAREFVDEIIEQQQKQFCLIHLMRGEWCRKSKTLALEN